MVAGPAWGETRDEKVASLKQELADLDALLEAQQARWQVLSKAVDDPDIFVVQVPVPDSTGEFADRTVQIPASQISQLVNLVLTTMERNPELVSSFKTVFPEESKILTKVLNEKGGFDIPIDIEDLTSPWVAPVVRRIGPTLVSQYLPSVEAQYAASLRRDNEDVVRRLQDHRHKLVAAIETLEHGEEPDGPVATGGEQTPTALGNEPFDTTSLADQAWQGTWEAQCKDPETGTVETKRGTSEIRFAGRSATITVMGEEDGDSMPLTVELDAQGAFSLSQAEDGGEFAASGQFQNHDSGDGSYAPYGNGTFKLAIDFSFLADAMASMLSMGAASEAELTPEQHEANTMRCNGTWELPLPG
jgi:hypothetical protein